MVPKTSSQSTLTKAESLLGLVAARLDTAFRYKEANPGGDFSHFVGVIDRELKLIKDICIQYSPTPPLTVHRTHPIIAIVTREWKCASEERRHPNLDKITRKYVDKCCARGVSEYPQWPAILHSTDLSQHAAEQPPESQWWVPHPDGDGRDASPSPPSPASQPPFLRCSPRTTKGKALLPVLPLDIKVGADQPRGIKRSAAVAAHIDEAPNEDQGVDGEPRPQKFAPAGRRVRFQSPPESRPKQRRRVDDDLKTTEAAPDELWVARGEDRCKPCKLVGRELCKPQWNASKACHSCVFCKGKSWSCNPPDSWFERVATIPHPKQARSKHDAPIDVGGSSETANAAPPTTEVEVAKRQSGYQKGGKASRETLTTDARLLRIESTIERNREGLAATERNQQEIEAVLLAICSRLGIAPELHSDFNAAAASTPAPSVAPSPVVGVSSRSIVPQGAGTNGDRNVEPSQEAGSQTSKNKGLRRVRCEEVLDTDTISGYVPCESCTRQNFKCTPRVGTKLPYPCARCKDAKCPCVRPTSAPTRDRRKGGPADRECATQPPHPATPVIGHSELPMGSSNDLPGFDHAVATLFWHAEYGRAYAACEAAVSYAKFVKEQLDQYERALAKE